MIQCLQQVIISVIPDDMKEKKKIQIIETV